ncbi:hypothetical protein [Halostella litorea]|uniref:hypothetical protein n=1 Tax=Halostella litorea TaxID=2528831 RepID=UPI00192A2735|nr:hypothetical protein [Halostella litorea]
MMGDDGGFEPAGYLREYVRGNVDVDPDAHVHSGLIRDPEMRAWVSWMVESYYPITDDMPASFWETDPARKILRRHGTETAHRAVQRGQMHIVDYLTGMPDQSVDLSTMDALDWLSDWVTRDAPVTLVTGHMNSGKTATTLKIDGKLWQRETGGYVASNIRTCPSTISISSMSSLVEFAKEHRDEPSQFVFDEAASHASGDLDDREVKEQMRQLIRFAAKWDMGLTIIGHAEGGRDISPEVRRFAEVIHKDGKKSGTIYGAVSERREYVDEKFEFDGLPDTTGRWKADPDEPATWEWDYEGDDLVDLSKDVDDLEWGVEIGVTVNESVGGAEEYERCRGVKDGGERCGITTTASLGEHGYCHHHDDQYDPDAEQPAYQRVDEEGDTPTPGRKPPESKDGEGKEGGQTPPPASSGSDENAKSDGDDTEEDDTTVSASDVVGTGTRY